MKIFSKYHDYYDSVLKIAQTEDDGVVYQRDTEEIIFNENQAEIKQIGDTRHFQCEHIKFLGFCGKIYTCVSVDFRDEPDSKVETFFVDVDDLKFIERRANYLKKMSRYSSNEFSSYEIDWLFNSLPVDSWWKRYTFINPFKLEDLFIRYETPIFLFERLEWRYTHRSQNRWRLTKNVCLKDFGFQRIVDPFTAFQEISMFFNSTLTNLKTPMMPVGDDKVLAASKGFDKWSFRKMGENSK
jgi:hypothetical protein